MTVTSHTLTITETREEASWRISTPYVELYDMACTCGHRSQTETAPEACPDCNTDQIDLEPIDDDLVWERWV